MEWRSQVLAGSKSQRKFLAALNRIICALHSKQNNSFLLLLQLLQLKTLHAYAFGHIVPVPWIFRTVYKQMFSVTILSRSDHPIWREYLTHPKACLNRVHRTKIVKFKNEMLDNHKKLQKLSIFQIFWKQCLCKNMNYKFIIKIYFCVTVRHPPSEFLAIYNLHNAVFKCQLILGV